MFAEFARRYEQRAWDSEEVDGESCGSTAPIPYGCTLDPGHELTHLAGVGDGYVIAEWDDDRSTDVTA